MNEERENENQPQKLSQTKLNGGNEEEPSETRYFVGQSSLPLFHQHVMGRFPCYTMVITDIKKHLTVVCLNMTHA